MRNLVVTSPAFTDGGRIPAQYTCDGADVNPPLRIQSIPDETINLVLIVDDPDAPMGTWDHWVLWNIPVLDTIEEDSAPGTEGINDFGKHTYGGPCPPSGTHRYVFKAYALAVELDLASTSRKRDVENAMKGHILAQGRLVGVYARR
jgi:Raf kinase inhibitor-like YbhB/YbcL family protein